MNLFCVEAVGLVSLLNILLVALAQGIVGLRSDSFYRQPQKFLIKYRFEIDCFGSPPLSVGNTALDVKLLSCLQIDGEYVELAIDTTNDFCIAHGEALLNHSIVAINDVLGGVQYVKSSIESPATFAGDKSPGT